MNLDDKTIMDLASQLGMKEDSKTAVSQAKKFAEKSDDQLIGEIIKIKKKLDRQNVPKEKQIAAVRGLMPMMNEEQKTRLAKLIELIES